MAEALSLHVGLNEIDPQHYGSNGALRGCESDARDMKAIAVQSGYRTKVLLTRDATSLAVLAEIQTAAARLRSGDAFLLTYSGHGSQITDTSGDERDGLDETWVLFDRMLIDDELHRAFSAFRKGVRIFVVSDSCHAGTVARTALFLELVAAAPLKDFYRDSRPKVLEPKLAEHARQHHAKEYLRIEKDLADTPRTEVVASLLLLGACQDNQVAMDGANNGAFTAALKQVWDGGRFAGGHRRFSRLISELLAPTQVPNFLSVGALDRAFERARPFTFPVANRVAEDLSSGADEGAWRNEDAIATLVSSCLSGAEVTRRRSQPGDSDGREVSVGVSVSVRL
jgi:hypothetical protein